MNKRALLWVFAMIGLAFPLAAQQAPLGDADVSLTRVDIFRSADSYALIRALPIPVQFTDLGGLGAESISVFPLESVSVAEVKKVNSRTRGRSQGKDAKDFSANGKDASVPFLTPDPISYGGEVGFLYGHSVGGKLSGDASESYINAGLATDKFQLNFGASYSDWDLRAPRRHR